MKRFLVVIVSTAIWAALLFGAAGSVHWPRGWFTLGLFLFGILINALAIIIKNPELIKARSESLGTKFFDKVFGIFNIITLVATPVVAGLDAVRYHWSFLPHPLLYLGTAMTLISIIPISWAMAVNKFLETTVRIQSERGHKVVSTGPYAFVRHPMYLGGVLQSLSLPLLLGSAWTFVPVLAQAILVIVRTYLEDQTLQNELPGYKEYTQITRYRLIPRVW